MKLATSISVLLLAAGMTSGQANAEEEFNTIQTQSINNCQAFLPAGAATRARPLGIKNDSTTTAFPVNCSWDWDFDQSLFGIDLVQAFFTNPTAAPVTVNCTFVIGWETSATQFIAKSTSVPAGATAQGGVQLLPGDAAGGVIDGPVSMSCSLPPLVTMNDNVVGWTSDDASPEAP